jgi:hypothetical protein
MARFESRDVAAGFRSAFGQDPTPEQVMFILKTVRHCRRYCRNNAALFNWVQLAFKNLDYQRVKRASTYPGGKDYEILIVRDRKTGKEVQEEADGEE